LKGVLEQGNFRNDCEALANTIMDMAAREGIIHGIELPGPLKFDDDDVDDASEKENEEVELIEN
jgi:hypothetical protein